ncbi:MAG: hypothetical protein HYZ57_20845 [Acidobacteria bacterium]|nr:hypothetical protein [Acidobacteriota bacterium]MBI3282274.1 hypothetical protein [Acidobacteriota bacterium]
MSGTRSRTMDTPDQVPGWTSVREKYAACKVTPTSSQFAMHANGKLYFFDDASQQMIRSHVSSQNLASGDWFSLGISGTQEGDHFHVSSIEPKK